MKRWRIYHLMREYSHELGDPIVGTVWADTEEDAITEALKTFYLPTGALVKEDPND